MTFVEGEVRAEVADEIRQVGAGRRSAGPHNFTNVGSSPARLYTVYNRPDHAPDTVHLTKADAEIAERQHHNG